MSVPDWSKDEHSLEQAKDYLRQGNTVDFFEAVSSAILREHPSDLESFCLEHVKKLSEDKPSRAEGDFGAKEEEDNKYMRAHNISEFLDKWVLALLNERPQTDADRMAFHIRFLEELSSTKKQ